MSSNLSPEERALVEAVERGKIDIYITNGHTVKIIGGKKHDTQYSEYSDLGKALMRASGQRSAEKTRKIEESNRRYFAEQERMYASKSSEGGVFHRCHFCGESRTQGWATWENRPSSSANTPSSGPMTDENGNPVYVSINLYKCDGCGHEFCSEHWRKDSHDCPSL